mmetsp:Transcript_7020/g.12647  ORF Transcript_7020/g.12647 Transcript_7020/m.12647 type:complete len:264 (-) Transcript_7020:82-873(-)
MLHGEHLAGPSESRLNLVGDHDDAVLVAQVPNEPHQLQRRLVESALALHRLHNHRGHAAGVESGAEQPLDRRLRLVHGDPVQADGERDVVHVRHHRPESLLVRLHLPRQAHSHIGAAVESAPEGDNSRAVSVATGDLDGILDGFGASGYEACLLGEVARYEVVEPLGKTDIVLVRDDLVAGVSELTQLLFDGGHHLGVTVAGVNDRDAGREVDVALALNVPDFCVRGALGVDLRHDADSTGDGIVAAAGKSCVAHRGSTVKAV